jgi:hypothetical protein
LIKVGHLDSDRYDAVTSPSEVALEIGKIPARVDIFTFMQIMPDTSPRFAYAMEMDNLAILPVSTFEDWWDNRIRSYPRNRARQAEKKGVVLREVPFDHSLVAGIHTVFNETRVRQGRPNSHYGMDLDAVRRHIGTFLDRSIFIAAFFEEKLIGFAKMVIDKSGTQASLMTVEAMIGHREKAPTNALIAHCVRACASRGLPYLMYQHMVYGNKEPDGIAHFKKINGFEQVDLPRYYIPLTPLGRFALRYGLHHSLAEQLPKPLAAKLRQFRNAWYNRKLQPETEGS